MTPRLLAAATSALLVGLSLITATTAASAAPACSGPDGLTHQYEISNASSVYAGTNLASDWVVGPHGGTISYSKSTSATVSASVTATVTAEAGAIFASASTSIGATVGKSWAKGQMWTYTLNLPNDSKHKYRMHLYHVSYNFTVTKQNWTCGSSSSGWRTASGYPQYVAHAPATNGANVWRLDSAAA